MTKYNIRFEWKYENIDSPYEKSAIAYAKDRFNKDLNDQEEPIEVNDFTMKVEKIEERLCPRCRLPMPIDDALNSLSHDGKTYVCSMCGQIESYEKFNPAMAEALKISQRRIQASLYGLDKNSNPKLPSLNEDGNK